MEILILLIIAVIASWFLPTRKHDQRYEDSLKPPCGAIAQKRQTIVARKLMLQGEHRFFNHLREALPNYHICPQVSFSALLTHAPHIWGEDYLNAVRRKFHHKFVDFVIYDTNTMNVVALVEYDGSGHNATNDTYRDGMLTQAGYRVERFAKSANLESIKERFSYLLLQSIVP